MTAIGVKDTKTGRISHGGHGGHRGGGTFWPFAVSLTSARCGIREMGSPRPAFQKSSVTIGQILAPMAAAGCCRKINDLLADDGFHAVGVQLVFENTFATVKLIDAAPDLCFDGVFVFQ